MVWNRNCFEGFYLRNEVSRVLTAALDQLYLLDLGHWRNQNVGDLIRRLNVVGVQLQGLDECFADLLAVFLGNFEEINTHCLLRFRALFCNDCFYLCLEVLPMTR